LAGYGAAVRTGSVVPFVLVAGGVSLYTSGPLYRVRTWWSFDAPLADDPVVVGVYAVVVAAAIVVLATDGRWRRIPSTLAISAAAVTGWYTLSAVWSRDPVLTLRESLFVGAALLAGAAAAVVLSLRALGWAVWAGVHVGLMWSFVALRVGASGTIDQNGDYAGVFFNRNSLALYAALGGLLGVVLGVDALSRLLRERNAAMWVLLVAVVVGFGIELWLLDGANAATPVVAATLALAATGAALVARHVVARGVPPRRVAAAGGVALIVATAVAWFTRRSWLDTVGRDKDLTGRADVWEVAVDWTGRRPVHGFGYLGLWGDRTFVREVRRASGHRLMSSHNAFIEALVGGGVIGLAAFVVFVAVVYLAVATRAIGGRAAVSLWPFAVFMFVLFENLTETLVVGNQLAVALLTATAVAATMPGLGPPDVDLVGPTGSPGRLLRSS
jgi:O-antigen ligase